MNKLYKKYYSSELTIDVPPQNNLLENAGFRTYTREEWGNKLYYGTVPSDITTVPINDFDGFLHSRLIKTKNLFYIMKCNDNVCVDCYIYNAVSFYNNKEDWAIFNKEDFISFVETQQYKEVEDEFTIEELMHNLSKEEFLLYLSDKIKENS